jgi:hypothetical protein
MPITKRNYRYGSNPVDRVDAEVFFVGQVLKVEKVTETRNWSDTLDYSDHRSTECTYALVWLGTRNVPPSQVRVAGGRTTAFFDALKWDADKVRDLEVHEQFAWIDCTNLFSDRNGYSLEPHVDTFDMQLLYGGPEMIDGVVAWEAYHKARLEQLAEEARIAVATRQALIDAEKAKKAAAQAKRDAKLQAAKSAAEALLARIPAKGTTVTVDGFTGKVFWVGISKYYGKWNARAGVKDTKGNVQWIDAEKF